MAKRKSPQELMAERNPLTRTAVAPIDIYNQPPVIEIEQAAPKFKSEIKTDKPKSQKIPQKPVPKIQKAKVEIGKDSPYSTYLFKHQVKGIKLRAIEREVKDKHIVQQAIDEYFVNHPL